MKLTQLNTEQLVNKCRNKDQHAQMEIYRRYYKAMYNTAYRILKNGMDAEDIMQEAFLNAFTKLEKLENDKLFGPWLKRIVINLSLSHIKKSKPNDELDWDRVEHTLHDDDQGVSEEDTSTTSITSKIVQTLHTLKQNYSTILSLHLIEGYDYDEICDIMDITPANCRTMISRAKESLRKKIEIA
ncbi:sigma-70 family RNA polymerase sigma factor [Aquimarina sp. TRL1]|nr:sigma-70 family RNA polymerase sigma factor [Aquimarina sp. TRL1]QKX06845.1 sigma-70 family RNA polymerase sigma factor [Aquimarina sp. TRL1]